MRDPYTVLGVTRSAGDKDIKSAYRKLAKAFHPDKNRNDPKAEAKFAEATAAYDLLSDKTKRGQFDRGEIDAEGNPKMAGFDFSGYSGAQGRRHPGGGAGAGFSAEDILKEFMGGVGGAGFGAAEGPMGSRMGGGRFTQAPARGQDYAVAVRVSLEQVHARASVAVKLPTGRTVSVKLPDEVKDGQQMRLKGQGGASPTGGPPGDVTVTIRIERHKHFKLDGHDLRVEVPIRLYEAVLGAKIRVPTLESAVELSIPPGVDTSKSLRLKGKGLYGKGDLYASLNIVLPKAGDPDLESLMRFWREQKPYKVRDED
ncbi:MAG TPA: DnaJ C-terminal domain-containing protein [Devosiaceae bacterium]|nr:DnaJ C-terminal domain-containing protein [Devosiaceae bacterium]